MGAINYSPMACGLLSGGMTAESIAALPADDSRRKNVQFQEPRLSWNLQLVELLREIGNAHGVNPGVVAVAWTLHNPAITGAVVGARTAQQVEELAPALEFRLSEDEYRQLDGFVSSAKWIFHRIYCRLGPDLWMHSNN
jgi:aryl-alcohol dehydrogenase-like predicted oxidoreductase